MFAPVWSFVSKRSKCTGKPNLASHYNASNFARSEKLHLKRNFSSDLANTAQFERF